MKHHITLFAICLSLASATLFTGCYHIGTPTDRNTFAADYIILSNTTQEPAIAPLFDSILKELLSTTPGFAPCHLPDAENLTFAIDLTNLESQSIASAELRNKQDRKYDSDGYQTVLQRIRLTASISVYPTGKADAPILKTTLTGMGDVPVMHDHDIPLQAALKQAALDIARQLLVQLNVTNPTPSSSK